MPRRRTGTPIRDLSPDEFRAYKNAKAKAYYRRNKQRIRAKQRTLYAANPEPAKTASHKYRREILGAQPRAPKLSRDEVNRRKRERTRRQTYNVSPEQYEDMIARQKDCCAICERSFETSRERNIDHDHRTGRVRKLLCCDCNRGLGCFRDSMAALFRAAEYIAEHED